MALRRARIENLIVSISLGTLAVTPFFGGWFNLTRLPFERAFLWFSYYHYPFQFTYVDIVAALLILVAVGMAGYALMAWNGPFHRSRRTVFTALALLALTLNLNMIRQDMYPIFSREDVIAHPWFASLAALASFAVALRYWRVVAGGVRLALMVLSPLALVVAANAAAVRI